MGKATVVAIPAKRWTTAASSIFSCGVRGTPSSGKTLKRVPELPYPHDGVSIRCPRRAALALQMVSVSVIGFPLVYPAVAVIGGRPWAVMAGSGQLKPRYEAGSRTSVHLDV